MSHILVVEDDEDVRRMVVQILLREGYRVTEAPNGQKALELFRIEPADLIVTDLIMPEKEGLEMIRDLNRDYTGVRVIAMSGGGRLDPTDYLKTARVFGARRTINKPFGKQELVTAVEGVLAEG